MYIYISIHHVFLLERCWERVAFNISYRIFDVCKQQDLMAYLLNLDSPLFAGIGKQRLGTGIIIYGIKY